MNVWEKVVYLFSNLISIYVMVRFAECFLRNCVRSKGWRISGMIACWLINSLAYLVFQNDTWNLITRVAGMMLITLIVYSDNILKKMMAAILALSVGVISETMVWFIFMSGHSDSPSQAVMSVVSVLLYFMLLLLTEHFCRIRKTDLFSDKYYLLIMVIPFLSICFIYLLFVDKVNDSLVLFVTLLTILVMNFFLFYLYNKIYELGKEKYEKQFLKEEVQMYERRFETMQQSRDKIRALRHDLLHHLQMLQHFAMTEHTEQLVDYIREMNELIEVETRGVNTGNEAVDTILDFMIEKAKRSGVTISVKSNIPKEEFISAYDSNVLLSNLLDNAIEAAGGCPDKEVRLSMKMEQGLLCVCVENGYDGTLRCENGRYVTRKQEAKEHGIGLQNVKDIVNKYDGAMEIQTDHHIFRVNLLLYL